MLKKKYIKKKWEIEINEIIDLVNVIESAIFISILIAFISLEHEIIRLAKA